MAAFLAWFNGPPRDLDGLLRAGLGHLWFVTLHPFEDGNGRLARTLTDLALAQDERQALRFFSLSGQILADKEDYYRALERATRGSLDVTGWLAWFLRQLTAAAGRGAEEIHRVLARERFWKEARERGLNPRQERVLERLLSPLGWEGGINNRKYVAIAGSNRTTAARDLADLASKGLLQPLGGGRSASYGLVLPWPPLPHQLPAGPGHVLPAAAAHADRESAPGQE